MVEMALKNVYKKYDNAENYSVTDLIYQSTTVNLSFLLVLPVVESQLLCE